VVNETAPISETTYGDDAAEAPVEDEVVDIEDSVEDTEDDSELETLVEYATKDELNRIRPMLGRYTKTLDQLQAKTEGFVSKDEVESFRQELGEIRDLLELGLQDTASEEVLNRVRAVRSEATKRDDRESLRKELLDELGQGSTTGATQANTSGDEIAAASTQVLAYARGKGLAPEDIPAEVWDIKQGQTLVQAMQHAESTIDQVLSERAGSARRTRKKNADPKSAPTPAASGTSYKGLTLEKLSTMSRDEIAELPKEVVDKVLASPS
jgi:hypothetical protein|tara:strand:- start:245 stop:1048 length:804 start_codon:yes stop_codon:yes gene_type:complete